MIGLLAGLFHFQPSELWELDAEDLDFWLEQAKKHSDRLQGKRPR